MPRRESHAATRARPNRFRLDIPRCVDPYRQGRLDLDDLVSRHITLEEVNEGYAALERSEVARSVLMFA